MCTTPVIPCGSPDTEDPSYDYCQACLGICHLPTVRYLVFHSVSFSSFQFFNAIHETWPQTSTHPMSFFPSILYTLHTVSVIHDMTNYSYYTFLSRCIVHLRWLNLFPEYWNIFYLIYILDLNLICKFSLKYKLPKLHVYPIIPSHIPLPDH